MQNSGGLRVAASLPQLSFLERHARRGSWGLIGVLGLAVCGPARAAAAGGDAEANRVAAGAMSNDYMSGRFNVARQKLERALRVCADKKCSPKMAARLYRDLAVVYLGGLGKAKPGKAALAHALRLDPSVRLDPDLTTPELSQAFRDAGGNRGSAPVSEQEEKIVLEEEPAQPSPALDAEALDAEARPKQHFFSLYLQQDALLHGKSDKVCYGPDYTCFDSSGAEYTGSIEPAPGNRASGGLGLATTRILLGFERRFAQRILLGARVGLALRGAPKSAAGVGFMPLHLELRGSYFFAEQPFVAYGLRPYAGAALGLAEVDGRVSVDYFDAGKKGTLDAWRKTGRGFVSANAGARFAFGSASEVGFELRLLAMVGTFALAPALALGYTHAL